MPVSSLLERDLPGALVYPRLPREVGRALMADHADMDAAELRLRGSLSHPAAAPAPTGGRPVEAAEIHRVQQAVRDAADAAGFPQPLRRGREQGFDRPCGAALYRTMGIVPADAAAEDVWTFLTLVVVPEIGPWRFPDRAENRILGRPRNVLRRLWWRAWSFGPDLDYTPDGCTALGEDEFVGIMERPSIGGNPRTARALRDSLWRLEKAGLPTARSEVARELTRRFRAFLSHICVDAITDDELIALVDEVGATALAALEAKQEKG
jgi:hypothetical protein